MNELATLVEEKAVCSILVEKVNQYFKDPKHRKAFEEWYRQRYGKEYEWR